MPIFLQKKIEPDILLALWHITETNAELKNLLSKDFFERDMHLKMDNAAASHYLASRVLLNQQFKDVPVHLHKNKFNKPLLELSGIPYHVSITHSHHFAGIILSKNLEVGMDLEKTDERINRVAHKFMNEKEVSFAGKEDQVVEKTIIWSAKETLYKIYGEKELDFKLHLHIKKFVLNTQGSIQTVIKKDDYIGHFNVYYKCFKEFILTYAVNYEE
ncbi:MAG: 4'-phosphopantetheinyl transferase superfamily protein [Bacteroidia bacterium]|nr:4'-phosphopantetheinyl transferase superfamily protein [Bacteroidia bacterium]